MNAIPMAVKPDPIMKLIICAVLCSVTGCTSLNFNTLDDARPLGKGNYSVAGGFEQSGGLASVLLKPKNDNSQYYELLRERAKYGAHKFKTFANGHYGLTESSELALQLWNGYLFYSDFGVKGYYKSSFQVIDHQLWLAIFSGGNFYVADDDFTFGGGDAKFVATLYGITSGISATYDFLPDENNESFVHLTVGGIFERYFGNLSMLIKSPISNDKEQVDYFVQFNLPYPFLSIGAGRETVILVQCSVPTYVNHRSNKRIIAPALSIGGRFYFR